MDTAWLYFFVLLTYSVSDTTSQEIEYPDGYYTAAVVDYAAEYDKNISVTLANNVANYENLIREAKQKGADIIVFPEYGLTSTNLPATKEHLFPFSSPIPDAARDGIIDPCITPKDFSEVVRNISCSAKNNQIYVVVNLPEKETTNETFFIYNTNVVFNRDGAIIAKYRKFNLFMEPGFVHPKEADYATFVTDFGVKFGLFTCFDILFDKPAQRLVYDHKILDFIFPTAWLSELPFLTALQTQAGWATSHGVNLLASNYRNPSRFFGGSGIYSARSGILSTIVPTDNITNMTIAKVPKIKQRITAPYLSYPADIPKGGFTYKVPGLKTQTDNLKNYTHQPLTNNVTTTIKSGKLSCFFSVTVRDMENATYKYKMVVYEGRRMWGVVPVPIQVCGVVACLNDTISSCGIINEQVEDAIFPVFTYINIYGKKFGNHSDTLIFPTAVSYDLNAYPYYNISYKRQPDRTGILLLQETYNLLSFGIYAHSEPDSAINLSASKFLIILFAVRTALANLG